MKPDNLAYATMEHWSDGQCSMVPVLYVPGEAWTLIDGSWRKIDSTEVSMSARVLDRASFETLFAATLIDLPDAAFQE
jgi:hypothetical protein